MFPKGVQYLNFVCMNEGKDIVFEDNDFKTIYKQLYSIDIWYDDTLWNISKHINQLPLLQKVNIRLATTVCKYGIIFEGKHNLLYHRLKWNKNKMRCCCLIYWKFKQIFGKDVARYVCDFILYGLAFPEDGWEYKSKHKAVLNTKERMQIHDIDLEIREKQDIIGQRTIKRQRKKEVQELELKKRKLCKEFYRNKLN